MSRKMGYKLKEFCHGMGIGVAALAVLSIFPLIFIIMGLMFEYSFMVFFGKNLPFYIDILGAMILNGANVIIWVVSLIIDTLQDGPVFPDAFGMML